MERWWIVGVVLVLSVGAGSCRSPMLQDRNGDGVVLIAGLGDSNTFEEIGTHPRWPTMLETQLRATCAEGDTLCPRVRAGGWGGTTAHDGEAMVFGMPRAARVYVEGMLTWGRRPDVAVLAWGTNDLLQGFDAPAIVAALADLAAQVRAGGVAPLVATVPPQWGTGVSQEAVAALNAGIVAAFSPCVIDLAAATPTATWFVDALHVNEAGQQARATVAARAMRWLPATCGA